MKISVLKKKHIPANILKRVTNPCFLFAVPMLDGRTFDSTKRHIAFSLNQKCFIVMKSTANFRLLLASGFLFQMAAIIVDTTMV